VKKVIRSAIQGRAGNDFIPGFCDGCDCEDFGSLTRSGCNCVRSAFQCGDSIFENRRCRIHDPGVDVAELLERKQSRGVSGVVKHVARGLVNRHGAGLGGWIDGLSSVEGLGFELVTAHFRNMVRNQLGQLALQNESALIGRKAFDCFATNRLVLSPRLRFDALSDC